MSALSLLAECWWVLVPVAFAWVCAAIVATRS